VRRWSISLSYNTPVLKMGTGLGYLLCANSVVDNCVQNDSAAGVCHTDLQNSISYIIRGKLKVNEDQTWASLQPAGTEAFPDIQNRQLRSFSEFSYLSSFSNEIFLAEFLGGAFSLEAEGTSRMTLTMNCCRLSASHITRDI
jgi:hypothetical protein